LDQYPYLIFLIQKHKHDSLFLPDQQARKVSSDEVVLFQLEPTLKTKNFERSNIYAMKVNQLVITRNPKMCNFVDYK